MPIIYFQIAPSFTDQIQVALLEEAARLTLRLKAANEDIVLTIIIEGEAKVAQLNSTFRDIDSPTDVLSFPSGEMDPDTGKVYLGDVVIAYPLAMRQALQAGHSISDELLLLTVHGVLHLMGYDHSIAEEKAAMWAAQSAILEQLGCQISPP